MVISGTADVTYCGPADGIISGTRCEKDGARNQRRIPVGRLRRRNVQNPPRPISTIAATANALKMN